MPIVRQLRDAGYSIWLDDGHIEAASLWAEQIVEGIKSCKVLLFMISEESINSHNVLKEVMLASELKKVILPVYLEECKLPDRYMYQLAGIQHVDLFKESGSQVVELLSDALEKAGATKLGDNAPLTDDATIPPSGHKFILNKPKFILSSVIGAFIVIFLGVLGTFAANGGNPTHLVHAHEIGAFLAITLGALFFFLPLLSLQAMVRGLWHRRTGRRGNHKEVRQNLQLGHPRAHLCNGLGSPVKRFDGFKELG